jgi:hypothetical protein
MIEIVSLICKAIFIGYALYVAYKLYPQDD